MFFPISLGCAYIPKASHPRSAIDCLPRGRGPAEKSREKCYVIYLMSFIGSNTIVFPQPGLPCGSYR